MHISFIAMNRMVETQADKDSAYRRELKKQGKATLSDARKLSDAQLLGKLAAFKIDLDRESCRRHCSQALSAEEVAGSLENSAAFRAADRTIHRDWLWLSLTVLWERWFPDLPSFERLDDRIQEGYLLLDRDRAAACDRWLEAWTDVLALAEKSSFRSLEEFDESFGGTQSIFNWIQDFEMELHNAGREEPSYHPRRFDVCEQFLRRFAPSDSLLVESMRRAMAESCFESGDRARGDALFEQWLKADPQWGWGWIGWSDCYNLFAATGNKDLKKAEALLKKGLAVRNVRDREDIVERLTGLYEEQGRQAEAAQLGRQGRAAPADSSDQSVEEIRDVPFLPCFRNRT